MKALFLGGIKSGKSRLAEQYIIDMAVEEKPIYLATNSCLDEEMQRRIIEHQQRRNKQFETIEEPLDLIKVIQDYNRPILVDCITIWLNNMLYYNKKSAEILIILEQLLNLPKRLVLVHNEVGLGIIPDNLLAREFADLSGRAGQLLAKYCDKVYFCTAGLRLTIK